MGGLVTPAHSQGPVGKEGEGRQDGRGGGRRGGEGEEGPGTGQSWPRLLGHPVGKRGKVMGADIRVLLLQVCKGLVVGEPLPVEPGGQEAPRRVRQLPLQEGGRLGTGAIPQELGGLVRTHSFVTHLHNKEVKLGIFCRGHTQSKDYSQLTTIPLKLFQLLFEPHQIGWELKREAVTWYNHCVDFYTPDTTFSFVFF